MKDNIYILGDTRLNVEDEKPFKKLWGDTAYFNSYCGNRRGITVLIKDGTPITDIEWENVIPGNFSKLSFRLNKQKVLIKCIYAPNKDSNLNNDKNESYASFKKKLWTILVKNNMTIR